MPEKFIKKLGEVFTTFNAEHFTLEDYDTLKSGKVAESVRSHFWNKSEKAMINALGIKSKDLKDVELGKGAVNGEKFTQLIVKRLDEIAKDPKEYEKVLNTMINKAVNLEKVFTPGVDKYGKAIDTVFDKFEDALKELETSEKVDLGNIKRTMFGEEIIEDGKALYGDTRAGGYKFTDKSLVNNKLLDLRSVFQRWMTTLDFYKRVNDPEFVKTNLKFLCDEAGNLTPEGTDMIKKAKNIINATTADFSVNMETFLREDQVNTDKFKQLMKVLYGVEVDESTNTFKDLQHAQTKAILDARVESASKKISQNETGILKNITEFRKNMIDTLCNSKYFVTPYSNLTEGTQKFITPIVKFLTGGMPETDYVFNALKDQHNSKTWMKMFGGFGAALVGVTVISQFFFGKMPKNKTSELMAQAVQNNAEVKK